MHVVAESRQVAAPRSPAHSGGPEFPGSEQRHGPGAPAVLLNEEGIRVGRAQPGRQRYRDVSQAPAGSPQVEPGMYILRVLDQRRAAVGPQRLATVYRTRTYADRALVAITGDL